MIPAPGLLLVAAPQLQDPHFVDSVVYLVDAGVGGAVGVVLNRPTPLLVGAVLPAWEDLAADPEVVFQGGPVETDGALALAAAEPGAPGIRPVADRVGVVDLDLSPDDLVGTVLQLRVFAGYAGWGAGQLEAEIDEGSWAVVPGLAEDVFGDDPVGLRRRVLRRQSGEVAWWATRPDDAALN
ncbi:YqgE/AlgH family protein [Nocardioides sp.]|uniref:YqgE/AlgH family protein n=1 Tax=Nocardioides sp. TaxID=35761 RepID=UPI00351988A8